MSLISYFVSFCTFYFYTPIVLLSLVSMQLYYFSPPYYSTLRTVLFLGSSVLWSLIAGLLKIGRIETVLGSSLVDLAVLWMAAVSFFEVFWNFYVFVTF